MILGLVPGYQQGPVRAEPVPETTANAPFGPLELSLESNFWSKTSI